MNPYKIPTPALVTFSGGRTSGYMLRKILDANNNTLPKDMFICFANTGKEMPQTLDFVRDCQEKWNVKVHWLELDVYDEKPIYRTKEVNYETASRNGEPFEQLINRRKVIPNVFQRFCTQELKVNVFKRFMKSKGFNEWTTVLGLRADEPSRVAKQKQANSTGKNNFENYMPLYEDEITKHDVINFWKNNEFDLKLSVIDNQTVAGNCDLCFLKGTKIKLQIIKEKPELADWWIEKEKQNVKFAEKRDDKKFTEIEKRFFHFNKQISYVELVEKSKEDAKQFDMFPDDSISCFCHD